MSLEKLLPYPARAIIRAGRAVVMDCKSKRLQEREWRLKTVKVTFEINGKLFSQTICNDQYKNMHPFMIYKSACAYLLSGDK